MRARLLFFLASALILTLTPFSLTSTTANINLEIQAITDAKTGSVDLTFNSKFAKASVLSYQITAKPNTLGAASYSKTFTRKVTGYISQRITPLTPGTNYKFKVTIKTTNKKVFNSADFSFYTASTRPNVPVITKAIETDADEAVVYFDAPNNDGQTPVLYYTANAYPGYATGITLQQGSGSITLTGLTKATTYRFTVTAHNINGTSDESLLSEPIKTLSEKIIKVTPASTSGSTLAAPAFTLSLAAETKTVGILSAGYAITETGGTATYSISPALPAGLSFSTSTGLISGTPTETRTATTHTITATNASGSASNTYRLRVNGDLGDIGPGGGRIFYYSPVGFNCGPTRAATCKYLEVAPALWNGGASDPGRTWAQFSNQTLAVNNASSPETATATGIGWGYRNTRAIILQGNANTASSAAALADSHTVTISGVVYDDWYLPSSSELNQMCKWARGVPWISDATDCSGGTLNSPIYGAGDAGFGTWYWTSTQASAPAQAVNSLLSGPFQSDGNKSGVNAVRPIRAF